MSPILWDCVGGFEDEKLVCFGILFHLKDTAITRGRGQAWTTRALSALDSDGCSTKPFGRRGLVKQALYLQQSLVYSELRHLN